MQVLLVEDDGETRDFIARGLREAGHQVTACATGQSGLIEATGRDFDAIVLDRMLPGVNDHENRSMRDHRKLSRGFQVFSFVS